MSEKVKRFLFYLIIFILIACYKDLQLGSSSQSPPQNNSVHSYYFHDHSRFEVVSYQAQQGDSYLMILEKLNKDKIIDIEGGVKDFLALNPAADVYNLIDGNSYLFPLYD